MGIIDSAAGEIWRYPRFFSDNTEVLSREDAIHADKVLRLKIGEKIIVCDGKKTDYLSVYKGAGAFEAVEKSANTAEAGINLRLFQCVPKSDKFDFIVQKAVELGANAIIPVISSRCVSRPDNKSRTAKTARWRKIAYEAAKQCGRGIIPEVGEFTDFREAVGGLKNGALGIIFYECGGKTVCEVLGDHKNIDVFIGSEGGFAKEEIELAENAGIIPATLGKRILRVETAPIAAISILMNLTGNM